MSTIGVDKLIPGVDKHEEGRHDDSRKGERQKKLTTVHSREAPS
jgi:hypothetical protein